MDSSTGKIYKMSPIYTHYFLPQSFSHFCCSVCSRTYLWSSRNYCPWHPGEAVTEIVEKNHNPTDWSRRVNRALEE